MTRTKKHSALFFLFIFTAYLISGSIVKGGSYGRAFSDASEIEWKKGCDNKNHFAHLTAAIKEYTSAQKVPGNDNCAVNLISCNSSLQILPALNSFIVGPLQLKESIQIESFFFATQTFVFQEPDPPRHG